MKEPPSIENDVINREVKGAGGAGRNFRWGLVNNGQR